MCVKIIEKTDVNEPSRIEGLGGINSTRLFFRD